MRKSRKILLLKAVLMSALCSGNSLGWHRQGDHGEGFDDFSSFAKLKKIKKGGGIKDFADKSKSKLLGETLPLPSLYQGAFNPEGEGHNEEEVYNVCRSILDSFSARTEERNRRSRELLELPYPYRIDLSTTPLNTVFLLLYNAHKYSHGDPIKLTLKLENVTNRQLDIIWGDPKAVRHIGKFEYTYRPDASVEEDRGDANEAWGEVPDEEQTPDEAAAALTISVVRGFLERADERNRRRRELLELPYRIDLNTTPFNVILQLLNNAQKYSREEPIRLKLNIANINKEQISIILSDENKNYIDAEVLKWTYQSIGKEKEEESIFVDAVDVVDANGFYRLPQHARRATRWREIEGQEENETNLEPVGNTFEPDEEEPLLKKIVAQGKGQSDREKDTEVDRPILPIWNITPLKAKEDSIGKAIESIGSFNEHAHRASKNFVKIYCRGFNPISIQ